MRRLVLFLLATACLAAPAYAQRIVLGLHFGVPLYWPAPYHYYYPAPYYAPYVYIPPALPLPPPAYAERDTYYWYYCASSKAYYPYVRECPGGWQRVPTVPPA